MTEQAKTDPKTDPKTRPGHTHDGPCITVRDILGLLLHSASLRIMRPKVAAYLISKQTEKINEVRRRTSAAALGKIFGTPEKGDAADALTQMFAALARVGTDRMTARFEPQPETGRETINRLRERGNIDDIVD